MELKIEYIPAENIRPYEGNAKIHTAKQIEQIKQSIIEFGFNDPIALWHGEVVEGHGRLLAAQSMGLKVPVIRLDELTDEQRRAYMLVHNKLTMNTGFDKELLTIELENLPEIDIEQFGLIMPEIPEEREYYGDERERTNRAYNLDLVPDTNLSDDFWQMPELKRTDYIPERLIGFNYAKSSKEKNAGIHFYVDDYQFERVWNYPEKYIKVLAGYKCILTPDFSLYLDMPMPMKIWNVYRSRQIGAYYQGCGLTVIPTVSWAEKETFEFAFRGIPKNSVVSISTIGVKQDKNALDIWRTGVDAMIEAISPKTILVYGGAVDHDYGDIEIKYFENEVTKNWKSQEDVV